MPEVIERARQLLEKVTPLATDCGQVCGGRCCRPDGDSIGMLLFPGEKTLLEGSDFTVVSAAGGDLLTCSGRCDRSRRPLSCRIFPLFPYMEAETSQNGHGVVRIRAVYDPRGYRICPLIHQCAHVPLDRRFVRAVRRAGRILAQDPACAAFMAQQSREIDALNRLAGLDDQRPPIARRRP